jgi:uncharacterized membrane protein YgdD (TMEM256/DUF423 family)
MIVINKKAKIFLAILAFMMALAISLGAFGAHILKSVLSPEFLKVYNTGVQYHFYNTLGLFVATIIYILKPNKKILISMVLILIGAVIFSFSLYFLTILNMPVLGAITPIGGTLLVIAWLFLAYGILKE